MATRIQELRRGARLTQQEMAAKAGLSIRTVAHIEAGRDVRVSTLQKYADALGISASELLQEEKTA